MLVILALGLSIAMIMSVYTGIEASNEKTAGLIDETITNTQENVEDAKQFIYEIEELTETQERMIQIGGVRGGLDSRKAEMSQAYKDLDEVYKAEEPVFNLTKTVELAQPRKVNLTDVEGNPINVAAAPTSELAGISAAGCVATCKPSRNTVIRSAIR